MRRRLWKQPQQEEKKGDLAFFNDLITMVVLAPVSFVSKMMNVATVRLESRRVSPLPSLVMSNESRNRMIIIEKRFVLKRKNDAKGLSCRTELTTCGRV